MELSLSFIFSFTLCLSSSLLCRPVFSVSFSLFLCLSFCLVFSSLLSLFHCLRVLLWWRWLLRCAVVCARCCGVCCVRCGVWCVTLKNTVCRFQHVPVCTFKTSPCVPAPRAHMVYTCARGVDNTRGRFERTHGDVLSGHTGGKGRRGGSRCQPRVFIGKTSVFDICSAY